MRTVSPIEDNPHLYRWEDEETGQTALCVSATVPPEQDEDVTGEVLREFCAEIRYDRRAGRVEIVGWMSCGLELGRSVLKVSEFIEMLGATEISTH